MSPPSGSLSENPSEIRSVGRPLIAVGDDEPLHSEPRTDDRRAEAVGVVKRLLIIVGDHARSATLLGIELSPADLRAVFGALRDHARGGPGVPVPGARDEIHSHVLDRLFDELVEEPSNVLHSTRTGPDSIRYEAMDPAFWIECLDLLENTLCPD